jgi:hypothetical protein
MHGHGGAIAGPSPFEALAALGHLRVTEIELLLLQPTTFML